jgi:hypothetical protein
MIDSESSGMSENTTLPSVNHSSLPAAASAPTAISSGLPIDTQICRLIADIKKDSIASNKTVSSDTLERLLKIMFPSTEPKYSAIQAKIELLSLGSQNYINELERIDSNDLKSIIISDNEHFQLNVLSSDLVHACASDAKFVFPETGLSPSKAVMSPEFIIGTAAGYLDPGSGSSEINCLYMPEAIEFKTDKLHNVGFPTGMNWKAELPKIHPPHLFIIKNKELNLFNIPNPPQHIYDVTITYPPTPLSVSISNTASGTIKNNGKEIGEDLEPLCKGNAEKNVLIEDEKDTSDYKAINLLLTKELGDVAQVLTYNHFVSQYEDEEKKKKLSRESVMITTDHVVYMLCKENNLSCIYTGAQKLSGTPRLSGHSHIVTYVGGDILTSEAKETRAIKFHKTNLIKYLNNKNFLISLCLFNIKKLQYVGKERGKPRLGYVTSKFDLTKEQIEFILKSIRDEIDNEIKYIESIDKEKLREVMLEGEIDKEKLSEVIIEEENINSFFVSKKEKYDTIFDLIIYQKLPQQKFIATEQLIAKLIESKSGGEKTKRYPKYKSKTTKPYLLKSIILDFTEINIRYFTIFDNIFEEISKNHIITIESAVFILYIKYKCRNNMGKALTFYFNIIYHKHKKNFSDYINKNKGYIFEILKKISHYFDKDIDYVVDSIVFTAQNIAEKMGLYTLDYYNKEENAKALSQAMTSSELKSAISTKFTPAITTAWLKKLVIQHMNKSRKQKQKKRRRGAIYKSKQLPKIRKNYSVLPNRTPHKTKSKHTSIKSVIRKKNSKKTQFTV